MPVLSAFGRVVRLLWHAWRAPLRADAVLAQLADLLVHSLALTTTAMAFIGAVATVDGGVQVQRMFGDVGGLGPAVLELVVREFGPVFGGIVAATRLGSGLAAEVASLRLGEQLDALTLLGVDPVAEVVAPRLRAALVAVVGLSLVSCVVAAGAGAATAGLVFHARPGAFLDLQLVDPGDLALAAAKAVVFGLTSPALAVDAGLGARPGASGVGEATTAGVVRGILAVVCLDLVLGALALRLGV
jgi:phospholipid/cholesterol/gamma-HCH transport system permease protein